MNKQDDETSTVKADYLRHQLEAAQKRPGLAIPAAQVRLGDILSFVVAGGQEYVTKIEMVLGETTEKWNKVKITCNLGHNRTYMAGDEIKVWRLPGVCLWDDAP